ncbi:MAG TPA: hypothetical protein VH186_06905 [Chloroflexia bacterium]|nr:hypothetical protein [Chloroflexia bacterium]
MYREGLTGGPPASQFLLIASIKITSIQPGSGVEKQGALSEPLRAAIRVTPPGAAGAPPARPPLEQKSRVFAKVKGSFPPPLYEL